MEAILNFIKDTGFDLFFTVPYTQLTLAKNSPM